MENFIEKLMYRSRWILAPIYLGLSLVLVALGINFFMLIFELLKKIHTIDDTFLILKILTLIDLAMVGGLIIMVMFSGYENFVSSLNITGDEEKLGWLGTMDSASLKAKIAASIVAISSIHLLKVFMNAEQTANDKIMWMILMHLTFVGTAFAMGFLDLKTKKK